MNARVDWLITQLRIAGGAENYLRQCAPRLRAAGWDLRVITLVNGGELVQELRAEGVPVLELEARGRADLGLLPRLLRAWKTDRPRLVHTHLYHAGLLGRAAARLLGISPVIVHQHGLEQARSGARSALDRLLSPLASCYVATCEAVRDRLAEREGISQDKIRVIYNGVEPQAILPREQVPAAERRAFQAEFNLRPGALRLVCAGRLAPEKGQDLLLEALARLPGAPLQAVLFGEGPMRSVLEQACAELGLGGRVLFAGARRDLRRWLPHFDLFALPSAWEGLSMALLEAMAAGLPAVATRVGGNPEVVLDGETGLLTAPGDVEGLARALGHLAEDAALRQRLGAAGRRRVEAQFNLERTLQELEALYTELLAGGA